MEDRKLEAAESLALIGRMIENTRSRMVRNSGRPLLAWGYATVLTTLAVWGAVLYFQDPRWNYLWLMLPLLGWLLMWISREKKPEGEVRTFVDRVIGNVWTVMGLSAWFVSMLALFMPMRLPILFIILLIMGMGTTGDGADHPLHAHRRRGRRGHHPRSVHADRRRHVAAAAFHRRIHGDDDRSGAYPQLQVEPPCPITRCSKS